MAAINYQGSSDVNYLKIRHRQLQVLHGNTKPPFLIPVALDVKKKNFTVSFLVFITKWKIHTFYQRWVLKNSASGLGHWFRNLVSLEILLKKLGTN